jgi:hypothetical protein
MEPQVGHACGVFGVYAPGQPVANLAYHVRRFLVVAVRRL